MNVKYCVTPMSFILLGILLIFHKRTTTICSHHSPQLKKSNRVIIAGQHEMLILTFRPPGGGLNILKQHSLYICVLISCDIVIGRNTYYHYEAITCLTLMNVKLLNPSLLLHPGFSLTFTITSLWVSVKAGGTGGSKICKSRR